MHLKFSINIDHFSTIGLSLLTVMCALKLNVNLISIKRIYTFNQKKSFLLLMYLVYSMKALDNVCFRYKTNTIRVIIIITTNTD